MDRCITKNRFRWFLQPTARPTRFRATTDQPAGFRSNLLSGRPKARRAKGGRRIEIRPKSVWAGRGIRKGRDRWEGRGGAHLARPLRPGRPAALPPFARSRRAVAEATQAIQFLRAAECSGSPSRGPDRGRATFWSFGSFRFSGNRRFEFSPTGSVPHHGVQDGQKPSDTSSEGDLLRLSGFA